MFLNECMTMLEPLLLMKGDFVYEKGEQAIMVYFLIQGRVNFVLSSSAVALSTPSSLTSRTIKIVSKRERIDDWNSIYSAACFKSS